MENQIQCPDAANINQVCFKYISITGCYCTIRQAVPVVDNPISKVKFMQIVFILQLLEMQIIMSSYMVCSAILFKSAPISEDEDMYIRHD